MEALWAAEAEDRLEALERGEIRAVPADGAFDAARAYTNETPLPRG